jgi:hypothetical protein
MYKKMYKLVFFQMWANGLDMACGDFEAVFCRTVTEKGEKPPRKITTFPAISYMLC